MRIVISEDMAMIRELFAKVCHEHGHEVVAATPSATQTMQLCREHHPDVLLLDVQLIDGNGLDAAAVIRCELPAMKIIVITAHPTAYVIKRTAELQVTAFIDINHQTPDALGEALAAIAEGKRWFSSAFYHQLEQERHNPRHFSKVLTPREQTVLALVGQSLSDEEIAQRLKISPRTAADHRSNLLHKLHLPNTSKLIAYATQLGIVEQTLTKRAI